MDKILAGFINQNLCCHIDQALSIFFCQGDILDSDKVIVEGCVGILRRANSDSGEGKLRDGMGRD